MFKMVSFLVLFFWVWTPGMIGPALAEVVGPHPVGTMNEEQLARWERDLVAQWLRDYGYEDSQVTNMLAGLHDEDIHGLVMQAENLGLPYGTGALEAVIALLLILILIIVILRLLNKEVIIA